MRKTPWALVLVTLLVLTPASAIQLLAAPSIPAAAEADVGEVCVRVLHRLTGNPVPKANVTVTVTNPPGP
ncbi:MAG: hypothetical protein ACREN5_12300, partial [Gemmatimonadales bacterium]